MTDFYVKASLSNKSYQKTKKLVSESAYLEVFNGAFTAWIAFTQQVVSSAVADLDVKASLSNKK